MRPCARGWTPLSIGQAGSAQLLIPLESLNKRVLIGTWQTRADWEAWHTDLTFAETRKRLEGLEATPREEWWHEVVLDMFKGFRAPVELRGITRRLGNARVRLAAALIATATRLRSGGRRA